MESRGCTPNTIPLVPLVLEYFAVRDEIKSLGKISILRMYCIDRAGVPENHDAHAFHCLYD